VRATAGPVAPGPAPARPGSGRLARLWATRRERASELALDLLVGTGLCRVVVMRAHGVRIRLTPAAMCRYLWRDRRAYAADLAIYPRLLRPGDTVVDAGANIGLVALVAARAVGARGQVHAIEAHPVVAGYLSENVRINRAANVRVHQVALGDRPGVVRLATHPGDDSQNHVAAEGPGTTVAVVRLDELLAAVGRVDLLKVDVEGYERFVVAGARGLLPRTRMIYFEAWERHAGRYGYTVGELIGDVQREGFVVGRLAGDGFRRVGADHVAAECENLLALRDVDDFQSRTGYRLV